jgi:hypothetical protein
MQRFGTYSAEDSCFIKYQSQNVVHDDPVESQTRDVEKGGVIGDEGPAAGAGTANSSDEPKGKGIFEQPRGVDTDESTLTDQEDKDDFPEGGLKGWSVVVGSFCGSFSVFGIINSTAVLLEYFQQHQLKEYSPSQIGWIFGLSLFLTFFCGAPIGPIFDAYGPRVLIFCGSILLIASMFLLGLCTRTYCTTPLLRRS